MTAIALWLRAPLRYKAYALDNWLHGYRFWILRSHRCCGHTVPSHDARCENGRTETP